MSSDGLTSCSDILFAPGQMISRGHRVAEMPENETGTMFVGNAGRFALGIEART